MVFDLLKKILQPTVPGASDDTGSHEPIQVATCVLLLEAAHADALLRDVELALVEKILAEQFALSSQTVAELMELASETRRESADLYQFTRQINDNFSVGQKLAVLENLWRVVFADGRMDSHEEALLRRLTTLLRLSHRQMIDAKLKVQQESSARGDGGKA